PAARGAAPCAGERGGGHPARKRAVARSTLAESPCDGGGERGTGPPHNRLLRSAPAPAPGRPGDSLPARTRTASRRGFAPGAGHRGTGSPPLRFDLGRAADRGRLRYPGERAGSPAALAGGAAADLPARAAAFHRL